MLEKLEEMSIRFQELNQKLSEPDIINDRKLWQELAKEHSILFYEHKNSPRTVSAYYCNGGYFFCGSLGSSPKYIDIFTVNQYTRSSEPMAPHMDSDIWNTFVQENVLMDTLAIYTYE